jgi:hypothetical protein
MSRRPNKTWLQRLGLREAAPDPAEWVPVFWAGVNDLETGFSQAAADAAKALEDAGLEVTQQPHVLPDDTGFNQAAGGFSPSASGRIRIAVLVHRRDFERAKEVLGR